MAEPLVIDPQTIENLRQLNPGDHDEFLREIVGIYFEDTPRRIVELEQSMASGDQAKFTRAAHSVKGSSANVGAMAVRAVAEQLEQKSKQGLGDVTELVAALKSELARAQAEFAKLLQSR